jgi:ribosomal-protein-alanine N-acetyltransferase
VIVFETHRLVLRKFVESDLDDLSRLYADPDIRLHFPEGTLDRVQTEEELHWFISGGDPAFPGLVLWAVIERETGRLAGRAGFVPWQIDGVNEVEIAYLLDKPPWGRGLGSEWAKALVHHGRCCLGRQRLIALIAPGNIPSARTALKAGLQFERQAVIDGHLCHVYATQQA